MARKACSYLESIFVSVSRGLTCIQVEPYESEGQSYELCRSERNPADNNNNNKKKIDSSSRATVYCGTSATQAP